jgi:hypothetical protein
MDGTLAVAIKPPESEENEAPVVSSLAGAWRLIADYIAQLDATYWRDGRPEEPE